jgi:hypothetical protein
VVRPDGEDLVAECALSAERMLPGSDVPQRTVHFTGRVRLANEAPAADIGSYPVEPSGPTLDAERVYSFYFHGPAYQVIASAWRTGETSVAEANTSLPDNHEPADLALVTAPRLIELCFQTAGLWQAGRDDLLALPTRVGRAVTFPAAATASGRIRAISTESAPGVHDCVVVDEAGTVLARLDGYETIALPAPIAADIATDLHATYRS